MPVRAAPSCRVSARPAARHPVSRREQAVTPPSSVRSAALPARGLAGGRGCGLRRRCGRALLQLGRGQRGLHLRRHGRLFHRLAGGIGVLGVGRFIRRRLQTQHDRERDHKGDGRGDHNRRQHARRRHPPQPQQRCRLGINGIHSHGRRHGRTTRHGHIGLGRGDHRCRRDRVHRRNDGIEIGRADDEDGVQLAIVEVERDHAAGQLHVGGQVLEVGCDAVGVRQCDQRGVGLENADRDVVISGDLGNAARQRLCGLYFRLPRWRSEDPAPEVPRRWGPR